MGESSGTVRVPPSEIMAPDKTEYEPVPLSSESSGTDDGGTDNPLIDFVDAVLERSEDGNLDETGWRIEIQRNAKGRLYWRWCKGGRKNRVRRYGGTFDTLANKFPDRADRYRPRHNTNVGNIDSDDRDV